jgi:tripartite ATP-independent transporter DctP family solute receptor
MRIGRIGLFISALCLAASAQAAEKLKWAHVYETTEPYHQNAVWAAEQIGKLTNGKYEISVFPASSLGKEADINEGLNLGTVDILITGNPWAARIYKPLSIAAYPYVFRSVDHWQKYAASEIYRDLTDGYFKLTGNKIVASCYYGQRHVTSKKPVRVPADMQGLKIRVPEAPNYVAFPKAAGANPTPIAFAEVYLALQQNVVDAQENPLPTIQAKKFYEVQKYINLTGHITDSLNYVIGGHLWKKLSDAEKKLFTDVIQQAADKTTAATAQAEKDLVAWFEKQGNIVVKDVDVPAMQKATAAFYANGQELPWTKDIWDRVQAIK